MSKLPIGNRVAVILTNYNMPERADALYTSLRLSTTTPNDFILVDNGSDITPPANNTTLWLPENRQTIGGWLAGLHEADIIARKRGERFLAYCFLITSAEFIDCKDNLSPCVKLLENDSLAVGVHPALTPDSTTHWEHMKARGGKGYRRTWMIDNIMSVWRADWFDSIGRFDPALVYGWGSDLETCYQARSNGKTIWIAEGARVKKVTNIGYTMGRMNMSSEARAQFASENMREVLSRKYGNLWYAKMYGEDAGDWLR